MFRPTVLTPSASIDPAHRLDTSMSRWGAGALLVALLLVSYGVAAVGGLATIEGVRLWYPTLNKPPWTPPNWAFGPIWSVLYTTMAVGAWDAMRRDLNGSRTVVALFLTQLALNALWSPLFFAWHQVGAALVVISLLWIAIAACIAVFARTSRLGAALYAPYLLWISIAWSLNAWILWFNQ